MYVQRKFELVNRAQCPDLARGDRRVHYLHVPKCGGTTIRYVLEGFAATRGLSSANEARLGTGVQQELANAQVAMSHSRPIDGVSRDDTCYFTILRDPIQRLRSLVAMIASRRGRPADGVVTELAWTHANWAVHLLSGATGPEGDPVGVAKQVLQDRIHLFGFQERLTELMSLAAAMLDIEGIIYPAFQYTPPEFRLDERFDETFAEMATADCELFDFALDLYRQRFEGAVDPADLNRRMLDRPYLCIRAASGSKEVDVSQVTFE